MADEDDRYSYSDESSAGYSDYTSSSLEDLQDDGAKYFVTKESQEPVMSARKESYAGLRDLTDTEKIEEKDIVASDGSIRGVKNRVRAGLANFENREALQLKKQEEGKIIIYMTSFRGVRSTFEDCRYVNTVMHNLRMKTEERDIYVNKRYYRELSDRLGEDGRSRLPVPQVFISGQHIGGKDKIEELNETGELRRLLENFTRVKAVEKCGYCGGYEFIPCRKCSGTKDSVRVNFSSEFKALRCTHCNENGLEPCPGCKEGVDGGDMWGAKELERWKESQEHEKKEEEERRKAEKRERIKREALEAEFQKQLKKEREQAERHRMKEEKKKKKVREEAISKRVVNDIEQGIEQERKWREERNSLVESD